MPKPVDEVRKEILKILPKKGKHPNHWKAVVYNQTLQDSASSLSERVASEGDIFQCFGLAYTGRNSHKVVDMDLMKDIYAALLKQFIVLKKKG